MILSIGKYCCRRRQRCWYLTCDVSQSRGWCSRTTHKSSGRKYKTISASSSRFFVFLLLKKFDRFWFLEFCLPLQRLLHCWLGRPRQHLPVRSPGHLSKLSSRSYSTPASAYAGSKDSPSLTALVRAILGLPTDRKAQMSKQERFDFCVVVIIFGALVAASVLSYYSQAGVYNI